MKRPDAAWFRKINREQGGLDEIGAHNIISEYEDYIARLLVKLDDAQIAIDRLLAIKEEEGA